MRPPGISPLHSKTVRREILTWSSSLHALVGYIFIQHHNTHLKSFKLHYHQYFYWNTISRWLPTKARESPVPNFMLEFSYLKTFVSQGLRVLPIHWTQLPPVGCESLLLLSDDALKFSQGKMSKGFKPTTFAWQPTTLKCNRQWKSKKFWGKPRTQKRFNTAVSTQP